MQELINSVARFSAAMTMFGLQEIQNVVGTAVDSQDYLTRFRHSLDSITNAVSAELDSTSRPALASVTNLSSDLVDRTFETFKTPVFDPRQMLQTASDVLRRTADSVAKPVAATTTVATAPLGEPVSAAEVSGK